MPEQVDFWCRLNIDLECRHLDGNTVDLATLDKAAVFVESELRELLAYLGYANGPPERGGLVITVTKNMPYENPMLTVHAEVSDWMPRQKLCYDKEVPQPESEPKCQDPVNPVE